MTTSENDDIAKDSTIPTFEEAKLCPKCGKPGEVRKVQSAPDSPWGTKLHHVYCTTPLCIWFNTCWMVQTNLDGSVPPARDHTFSPKKYVGFEGHDREAEALINELKTHEQIRQQGETPEIHL